MLKWHCAASLALIAWAGSSNAADESAYPQRPIRVISSEVGGSGDFVMRLLTGHGFAEIFGQPVIVDNRATAVIPDLISKAAPDGYTLLVIGASFWTSPLLRRKAPYDVLGDFSPIVLLSNSPQVFVVQPSLPVRSIKELIALAKIKPGNLNYGYTVPGTPVHIASELFKSMAGVDIVAVSYKGTSQMINALLGGEIQLLVSPVAAAIPQIRSGKLRALGITSARPSPLLPDIPTVASSGLVGYEIGNTNGMFAPGKTPVAIVNQVNRAAVQVLAKAEVRERLLASGIEPVGSSPSEFADAIRADMARMTRVIKDSGMVLE